MIAGGFIVFGLTVADIVGSLLGDEGRGGVLTGRGARLVWRVLDGRGWPPMIDHVDKHEPLT